MWRPHRDPVVTNRDVAATSRTSINTLLAHDRVAAEHGAHLLHRVVETLSLELLAAQLLGHRHIHANAAMKDTPRAATPTSTLPQFTPTQAQTAATQTTHGTENTLARVVHVDPGTWAMPHCNDLRASPSIHTTPTQ